MTALDHVTVDDRELVVTAGADGAVRLWDLETGAPRGEVASHDGPVTALCCREIAGRAIAVTGGADGAIVVHDLSTAI